MAEENKANTDTPVSSENIFDEFTNGDAIRDEISRTELAQQKDIYYYLKKLNFFAFFINIVFFIILIIGFLYIYIQENETKKEYAFLSPICGLFLGDESITPGTCYGVTPILNTQKELLSNEIEQQTNGILPVLGEIYSMQNFNHSKKVSFLLEKNDIRLRPLEVLTAFDELKNVFSPTDKGEIQCYSISMTSDILDITCEAYSSDWNTDIVTLEDGSIDILAGGGTSISRASSFIYFIEKYRDSPFLIIEKPRTLSSESIQLGPYSQKTTFDLKLQYSPKEDLIF